MNKILEIKNLTKEFIGNKNEKIQALRGVTFDIYKGEILGLLGANGAGKTTLSSILATLHPQTSGEILFKEAKISENIFEYRKQIGFCPQSPNLYPTLTIRENLFYSGLFYGLSAEETNQKIESLLDRYSLRKYENQFIKSLSGGYKQRASIARALIHNPKIIFLDEPTVGLDPHIRRELWTEIQNLKELGVTVILTTHYLDEAEILSDRVCVLEKGKIKFLDTPENLKKNLNKSSLEDVMIGLLKEE